MSLFLRRPLIFRPEADKSGSILVLSLWSLCLLSTFAVIMGHGVRQKLILVQRLEERGKLRYIADAGIKKAIAALRAEARSKMEDGQQYYSLLDGWSGCSGLFRDRRIGSGNYSIYYRRANSGFRYGLCDEESKININTAKRNVLQRLFKEILSMDDREAQELSASIVDWRDSDSELSIPMGSAEDHYYISREYPYESKDALFEVPEELLLVRGMTEDIFKAISGYITIFGSGKVNINTAPKEVLLATGLGASLVNKILLFRNGADRLPQTLDDNIYFTEQDIVPMLEDFCQLSPPEKLELEAAIDNRLSTSSGVFTIRCVAGLDNKKITAVTTCVADVSGAILYWREP